MIKAIFVDWGNTFSSGFKKRDREFDGLLEPFGLNWKEFFSVWYDFYLLRSAGRIRTDEELEILLRRAAGRDIPVKEIIKIIIGSHIIPPEHVEVVRELKKRYKVGILSNNVKEWAEEVLADNAIENLFDALIISSEVGVRKPDALIYYEALERFSVKPGEAVFVADEAAEDLVAATGLGIKTVWLKANPSEGWSKGADAKILKIYTPDAVIEEFADIVSVVENLAKK